MECNLGRWTTQHEDDYAPWESIKKVPIWEGVEWGGFRSVLARPELEPELETSDEAELTMHVEGQILRDGESIEGPQVMLYRW